MKNIYLALALTLLLGISNTIHAQTNVYTTSGGEIIFSWGELQYTDKFMNDYPDAQIIENPVRFTVFFHFQQLVHMDMTDNIGIFSGIGMRNIGLISDEQLPENYNTLDPGYFNAKIIRRTYSLGLPIAIKLGSFKNNFYLYGGAEIEWAFHSKEKWWAALDRDGSKTKKTDWFPSGINTWMPSYFVGIQFPGGANVKFRYYSEDFFNHSFGNTNATNRNDVVSDLTKYSQSSMVYISLSYQINTMKALHGEFDDY
jgi:hypothetical protein